MGFQLLLILVLLGMYFDAVVVFVTSQIQIVFGHNMNTNDKELNMVVFVDCFIHRYGVSTNMKNPVTIPIS